MTFTRLTRGDTVAMLAALALLLVMSLTWYSTVGADTARQIEDLAQPRGGDSPDLQRIREDASFVAERGESSAWQLSGVIDRVILGGLLATILLAVSAAWLRAGDRRFDPPLTPSAAAAGVGGATAALVAFRMVQEPGQDAIATVEPAALLALALLAVIAVACRAAWLEEVAGTAWGAAPADKTAVPAGGAGPVGTDAAVTTPRPSAVLEPVAVPQRTSFPRRSRPAPSKGSEARPDTPPESRPAKPPEPEPPTPRVDAPVAAVAANEADAREVAAPEPEAPLEEADATKISLATATVDELRTLNGIGPALARRIVEHRERAGGFDSVDGLGEVEGIGARRLSDLKDGLRP